VKPGAPKILVVDDEAIIVRAFTKELAEAGYDVTGTQSGVEAIQRVRAGGYSLVFTNLLMPEMTGVEVCREIKSARPEVDVVLVSGSPIEIKENEKAFVAAGGRQEILKKPLKDGELVKTVEYILSLKKEIS
jgi:CheY-like chemotaxis protein